METIQQKFLLFLSLFLFAGTAFAVPMAFAARVSFSDSGARVNVGDQLIVDVLISVDESEPINAVSGTIAYPAQTIRARGLRDGASFVPLWIEQPEIKEQGRDTEHISFAGVIPGGFSGLLQPFGGKTQAGLLFSIIFEAKETGSARIAMEDIMVLLHDGKGTPAEIKTEPRVLTIYPAVDNVEEYTEEDTTPPEEIFTEITNDPALFAGKWFIAFYTTDKESGISYYEVKEGDGEWIHTKSPYLLSDQSLTEKIFVKAIDRAGNIRVKEIAPSYPLLSYKRSPLWGIIGVLLLVGMYFYLRKKHSR